MGAATDLTGAVTPFEITGDPDADPAVDVAPVALVRSTRRAWADRLGIEQRQWPLLVAAAASGLATAIHAVLTPVHFRWWVPAGAFFLACTVVQVVLAAALLGAPSTRTLLAAVGTNLVVIAVYVVSRTSGIPGAPGIPAHGSRAGPGVAIIPGAVEKVGSNDLVALVAEIAIVVLCALCLPDKVRNRVLNLLTAFGVGLVGLWWTGVLT